MEEKNNEMFTYTYSAAEQKEIEKIRAKYIKITKTERELKMERLRKLDESAVSKGMIAGIVTGVLGTLLMGVGMSCSMVWGESLFVPGIMIGLVGIAGVATAYPLFKAVVKKERERIAPEVLKLTEELL